MKARAKDHKKQETMLHKTNINKLSKSANPAPQHYSDEEKYVSKVQKSKHTTDAQSGDIGYANYDASTNSYGNAERKPSWILPIHLQLIRSDDIESPGA